MTADPNVATPPDEPTPDPAAPGGSTPAENDPPSPNPVSGNGFGVVALTLGGLGCLLPLLPFALGDARAWISLPFALPGLVIGIMGTSGPRRGNVWAITGSILCAIAVGLSAVMLIGFRHDPKATAGPGHTAEILRDELDVRIGERYADPETGEVIVTVTLYNKGQDTADYGVKFEVSASGDLCEDTVAANDLAPGASHQGKISGCNGRFASLTDLEITVTEASKSEF